MSEPKLAHDPSAVLDYSWDWGPWLADGETITAQTVTVTPARLTVSDVTRDASTVTAWLTGTPGPVVACRVVCHVTTSQGRQDDRSQVVVVTER